MKDADILFKANENVVRSRSMYCFFYNLNYQLNNQFVTSEIIIFKVLVVKIILYFSFSVLQFFKKQKTSNPSKSGT